MKLPGKSIDKKKYLSNDDEFEEIDNYHCPPIMMNSAGYTSRVFQMKTSCLVIGEADLLHRQ